MGIGCSGRAHDHDLCVIMTATTIKYTEAILPMRHGRLDEESPFQLMLSA